MLMNKKIDNQKKRWSNKISNAGFESGQSKLVRLLECCRGTIQSRRIYLYCPFCIISLIIKITIMSKLAYRLLIIISIVFITLSHSCTSCNPPIQIKSCTHYKCYHCGVNQYLDPIALNCVCTSGNYRINGVCGQCPPGYDYDQLLLQCIGTNPCGLNQELVNGTCQCLPGLHVIQSVCQGCPINQTYYPRYDQCRCSIGYVNASGLCFIANCSKNQVYDQESQQCICVFGFYLVNGVCGQCTPDTVYDSSNQSCQPYIAPICGRHQYWFQCCCFCQVGYVKIRGLCQRCPPHSSYDWNLDACVCDDGFYFVGQQVLQLPYQSSDTGSSFTSNPGYVYYAYGPSTGVSGQKLTTAVLTQFSNYDQNGINTLGANFGNFQTISSQNPGPQNYAPTNANVNVFSNGN